MVSLYGDDRDHIKLRNFVADYLKAELPFFRQFIIDTQGPEHYLKQLRKDGEWADDLEIQIISELYDCRIEVFGTSNNPIKVFNEKPEAIKVPLRLFYLQQCHYDVIWDPRRPHPLKGHRFGQFEEAALEAANHRDHNNLSNQAVKGSGSSSPHTPSSPSKESRDYFEKYSSLL